MNIEIRRNTSLSFSLKTDNYNRKAFEKLLEQTPNLTEEEQAILDKSQRTLKELERKIWEYLKEHPTKDLDGDLITEETHEIGYDVTYEEIKGTTWAVAKQFYIQPKYSSRNCLKEAEP